MDLGLLFKLSIIVVNFRCPFVIVVVVVDGSESVMWRWMYTVDYECTVRCSFVEVG